MNEGLNVRIGCFLHSGSCSVSLVVQVKVQHWSDWGGMNNMNNTL